MLILYWMFYFTETFLPKSLIVETLEAAGPTYGSTAKQVNDPATDINKDTSIPTPEAEVNKPHKPRVYTREIRAGHGFRLRTGSDQVFLEVDIGPLSQPPHPDINKNQDIIELKESQDGSKHLIFKFDKLMSTDVPTAKPELNQVYVSVVQALQQRTNFETLSNQADYLIAIARILEAAYFGFEAHDSNDNSQEVFEQLVHLLVIYPLKLNDNSNDEIVQEKAAPRTREFMHYASEKDLNEQKTVFTEVRNKKTGKSTRIYATINALEEIITITERKIDTEGSEPAGQAEDPTTTFQDKNMVATGNNQGSSQNHIVATDDESSQNNIDTEQSTLESRIHIRVNAQDSNEDSVSMKDPGSSESRSNKGHREDSQEKPERDEL